MSSSIRSDTLILPPDTLTKGLSSMRNVTTGAATSTSLWEYADIVPVSSTNATPVVMTLAAGHGFIAGDVVTVAGHTTNTGANGTWTLGAATATTVTLTGSVGNGVGGATGTINFRVGDMVPKTKGWITVEAVTADAFIRIGLAATAGTTALNGLLIPLGTAAAFYVTPSKHQNVDHFCATAGSLKWYFSSPPCERERI